MGGGDHLEDEVATDTDCHLHLQGPPRICGFPDMDSRRDSVTHFWGGLRLYHESHRMYIIAWIYESYRVSRMGV